MSKSTLIKRGQAQGCGSADIHRRHVYLPHDAIWSHPSHHHIVKVRSTSASHPDIPKEPIAWHVCPHDGPSWPSSGSWQLGGFNPSSCVGDVHGSHRDALRGDQSVENEEPRTCETWEWYEARKSKQRLPPAKKFIGQNMSCDPAMRHCTCLGACRGNSIINWGCVILISHSFLDGIA